MIGRWIHHSVTPITSHCDSKQARGRAKILPVNSPLFGQSSITGTSLVVRAGVSQPCSWRGTCLLFFAPTTLIWPDPTLATWSTWSFLESAVLGYCWSAAQWRCQNSVFKNLFHRAALYHRHLVVYSGAVRILKTMKCYKLASKITLVSLTTILIQLW